jgi:enterochelin esterase-like enzyme
MKKNARSRATFKFCAPNSHKNRRARLLLSLAFFLFASPLVLTADHASFATPAPVALSASQTARYTLKSEAFSATVPYMVYLPAGYGGGKRYPVWYAMHGYSSTETMWLTEAGVDKVADALIENGKLAPMIMIFPLSRYDSAKVIQQDMLDGKRDASGMERFLCDELIPSIDSHYSSLPSPENRYISGFSMGGLFALQIGLHRPDLFGKIGAYSPALETADFSGDRFERWLALDPAAAKTLDGYAEAHGLGKLSIYLDCGDERDPFSTGAASLEQALTARGIAVEFHPHDGGHSLRLDFLEDYLLFFAGL